MSLHLNGQKIKGSDIKIGATLSLASDDISGQSSISATAETGDKPKTLSVNMQVKYDNANDLSALVNLAQDKSEFGERVIYTIVNATAKAMNIRKVRFQGDLSVREDESLELWRVAFKLVEAQSVPELKESRQTAKTVTDQAASGTPVEATDTTVPDTLELSGFEKILQYADNAIAGSE